MLEIKNPSLTLGGRELLTKDTSFIVNEGEILCVSGGRGAGKTTLLRVLMGLQPLDSGYVNTDGDLIDRLSGPYFRRMMGYVPQQVDLPYDTVEQLVDNYLQLRATVDVLEDMAALREQWRIMGIDSSVKKCRPAELGTAQLQWLVLSLVAVAGKRFVFVDDPHADLDKPRLMSVLQHLAAQGAVVVVTGNDSEVVRQSQCLVNLSGGMSSSVI